MCNGRAQGLAFMDRTIGSVVGIEGGQQSPDRKSRSGDPVIFTDYD